MTKVTFPDGTQVEMTEVEIADEKTPWNTFKLEDGTELKIRLNVVAVQRAKDKFDSTGKPAYQFQSNLTVRARVPPKLMAKAVDAKKLETDPAVA